ncbi:MAG: S-layer homology domain-containing protein [Gammaproteobacteria bacterium]|nr:S-layer homology domain-containing protein [Gammaproteobacteria bacterium]
MNINLYNGLFLCGVYIACSQAPANIAFADTSAKNFGPSGSYTDITEHGIVEDNDLVFDWSEINNTGEFCGTTGSTQIAFAPVHLDSGVLLTRVDVYGDDNDPVLNLQTTLFERCHSGPKVGSTATIADVKSSGSPGMFSEGVDVSATIDTKNCGYYLRADATADHTGTCPFDDADLNTTVRTIRFTWQRQIAPGPSMPSFFDVPNSHTFYDSIEALASSGITGGCGGSNFCPDDVVTRGQFAAFFSRALGLGFE